MPRRYEIIGIEGLPEVDAGADIARLIAEAAARQATPLEPGDLLVVGQKIVSKAEGRGIRLAAGTPADPRAPAPRAARPPPRAALRRGRRHRRRHVRPPVARGPHERRDRARGV